jgi:hypothetical protein
MSGEQLTALLSIGVAIVVAFIGFLQWRTAREQGRTANNRAAFDQFQKRYEVYQEIRDIALKVRGSRRADEKMLHEAVETSERARFLFGDDVIAYLAQFSDDVRDLAGYIAEESNLQVADRKNNLDEQRRLINRIEEFHTKGPTLFGSYIRFAHKIH